jgi:hypothetical protein
MRRSLVRKKIGFGLGSKLGVHNPKAKDLLARKAREEKRRVQSAV